MIDGSEKRKRQLVFELQSSRVYEKRSNIRLVACWESFFGNAFFFITQPLPQNVNRMLLK